MRKYVCGPALIVLVIFLWSEAGARERLNFGKTAFAWHPPFKLFDRSVLLDEPDPDGQLHDQDMLAEITGDPEAILKMAVGRSVGLRNGFAVIIKGQRYIVYDPAWFTDADAAARYLILAHEVGHHVCGHTAGTSLTPHERELEADRYTGAAVKRIGLSLHKVQQAAAIRWSAAGSTTHPSLHRRLAAMTEGYDNGSSCD
jgi:hypothetical protein